MPPPAQLLTRELFDSLILIAGDSPRRRTNHNFHTGPDDNPHRFLNVFLQGSYVSPHRHLLPPKAESFIVLEGWMLAITFDDAGVVQAAHLLGVGPLPQPLPAIAREASRSHGLDLPPGVWHTVTAITPHAVCFEVKPGPWDPTTDKEFASWAPREADAGAAAYLNRLLESEQE